MGEKINFLSFDSEENQENKQENNDSNVAANPENQAAETQLTEDLGVENSFLSDESDDNTPEVTDNLGITSTDSDEVGTPDYYDTFMGLVNSGYIDLEDLPETVSTDPDSPTTAEDTLAALLHNLPKRDKNIVGSAQSEVLNRLPKEFQESLKYASNGGDPVEYVRLALETHNIKSLNPEDTKDQEQIVREYYRTMDLTTDELNEKIEDLKDASLLAKEAAKLKPKLDKRAEAVAQSKLESQAQIKANKDAAFQTAAQKITNSLVSGFDNINFSKEEASDMLSAVMSEQEFDYGVYKATKTGIEFLIDYHKYSEQGDPARVIKALMILDPQGRFDEKFQELFRRKAQDQFVNEHLTNNQNKFKVRRPAAANPTPKKGKGKFQFKQGI